MLRFIIKRMLVRNQEAWDALEEYIKMFDIRNFPSKHVPTACLKLKAVVTVLGNKLPSNTAHRSWRLYSCFYHILFCLFALARLPCAVIASMPCCWQLLLFVTKSFPPWMTLNKSISSSSLQRSGRELALLAWTSQKSSYLALADPDQDDNGNGKCYAAYLKTKSCIPFEE